MALHNVPIGHANHDLKKTFKFSLDLSMIKHAAARFYVAFSFPLDPSSDPDVHYAVSVCESKKN